MLQARETSHSWVPKWLQRKLKDTYTPPRDNNADSADDDTGAEILPADKEDERKTAAPKTTETTERGRERGPTGVVTDQKLLQFYFHEFIHKDVQPVTTDRFLDRSRSQYNSPWLAREIVQNFVDHNPGDRRGTLNGVQFKEESIAKNKTMPNGGKRFTIRGAWKFPDLTGITSLHSDKPDTGQSAGGNGIGLKQTVLRFLRDFGVQKFQVQGEDWTVDYFLARAQEVNRELTEKLAARNAAPVGAVKHDWLLADIQESKTNGSTAYVIETDNEEVIVALREFPNLGVLEGNKFLKDLDYQNEHGAIKWLEPEKDDRGKEIDVKGRLYLNGQVMHYKDKGKTKENYWQGPELVTVVLKDVKYEMSVDRPPLDSYQFDSYLNKLVDAMSTDDIVKQLQVSEYIWTMHTDEQHGSKRDGCSVVIGKMIEKLKFRRDYDKEAFAKHCKEKKYLSLDYGVSTAQTAELQGKGFIICSSYFEGIGMPKASSELSSVEAASNQRPGSATHELERVAKEFGLPVAFEEMETSVNLEQFFTNIREKLAVAQPTVTEVQGKPNTFRINLGIKIPKELLFHQLPRPKKDNPEQQMVYFLRSFIFAGLRKRAFEKVFSGQGDYITTYDTNFDTVTKDYGLIVRNIDMPNTDGVFIEMEFNEKVAGTFKQIFLAKQSVAGTTPVETTQENPYLSPADAAAISDVKKRIEAIGGEKNAEPVLEPTNEGTGARPLKRAKTKSTKNAEQPEKNGAVIENGPESAPGPAPHEARVIVKDAELSVEEQARLSELERRLPEVRAAVEQLKQVAEEHAPTADKNGQDPIEQYLAWKQTDKFYGQLGANAEYLTGRHLIEILNEHNQADIAVAESGRELTTVEQEMAQLNAELKQIANNLKPKEDHVDEFEIVLEPTEKQLAQLSLLRLYARVSTDVVVPNDLFVYSGTGSKGINLGTRAIGLHEELFKVNFFEALSTFTHEIAHNEAMNHGPKFMHMMQSLFMAQERKLLGVSNKLKGSEPLSSDEEIALDIEKQWEMLRAK